MIRCMEDREYTDHIVFQLSRAKGIKYICLKCGAKTSYYKKPKVNSDNSKDKDEFKEEIND